MGDNVNVIGLSLLLFHSCVCTMFIGNGDTQNIHFFFKAAVLISECCVFLCLVVSIQKPYLYLPCTSVQYDSRRVFVGCAGGVSVVGKSMVVGWREWRYCISHDF